MAQGDVTCNINNPLARRCAMFDGTNDKVTITFKQQMQLSSAFSISAWVFPRSAGENNFGRIFDQNGRLSLYVEATNNRMSFAFVDDENNSTIVQCNNFWSVNNWVNVIITYDGTTLRIYKNGEEECTDTTLSGDVKEVTNNFLIGDWNSGTRNFDGGISDVRLWKTALTPTEVSKVYAGGNVTRGLISRWKLDFDYTDEQGVSDGTNSGSYLASIDDVISEAVSDARETENDIYQIFAIKNKIMSVHIEEA